MLLLLTIISIYIIVFSCSPQPEVTRTTGVDMNEENSSKSDSALTELDLCTLEPGTGVELKTERAAGAVYWITVMKGLTELNLWGVNYVQGVSLMTYPRHYWLDTNKGRHIVGRHIKVGRSFWINEIDGFPQSSGVIVSISIITP